MVPPLGASIADHWPWWLVGLALAAGLLRPLGKIKVGLRTPKGKATTTLGVIARRRFQFRLPYQGPTIQVGMDDQERYFGDLREVSDQQHVCRRVMDNATGHVLFWGLLVVAVLVIEGICWGTRHPSHVVPVVSAVTGASLIVLAVAAQFSLWVRSKVEQRLAVLDSWRRRIEEKPRVQFLGTRMRVFDSGAFASGLVTNTSDRTCIVVLGASPQCLFDFEEGGGGMFADSSWIRRWDNERDLVAGTIDPHVAVTWKGDMDRQAGASIRLAPGESFQAAIGCSWGAKTMTTGSIAAGFPVFDGYGVWVKRDVRGSSKLGPDEERLVDEFAAAEAAKLWPRGNA